MGFFKNLISTDLVQDKYKKDWAEKIYNSEEMKDITDKYALGLNKDIQQLIPEIKADVFIDDNLEMKALIGKALISHMIEQIFKSAQNDRQRIINNGAVKWDTPSGIAQGAVNLIQLSDPQIKKLFISFVAMAVIGLNSKSLHNDINNWLLQAFRRNGWKDDDIDEILNF